jgi:prepilin-type N-terminal cleavage/methylation domain-containing protein
MTWRIRQHGDTIIEVLIAITVVSSMLAGAYVTSNKSLIGNRQAEERGEALKLVQSQVEKLIARGGYQTGNLFCIDASNNLSPEFPPAALTGRPWTSYPTACVQDTTGTSFSASSISIPYHLAIAYDSTAKVYTIYARWDAAGGNNVEQTTLKYRVAD